MNVNLLLSDENFLANFCIFWSVLFLVQHMWPIQDEQNKFNEHFKEITYHVARPFPNTRPTTTLKLRSDTSLKIKLGNFRHGPKRGGGVASSV